MNVKRLKGEPRVVATSTPHSPHESHVAEKPNDIVWYSGKQLVYHALQDLSEVDTPETIAAVDEEIQQMQNDLSTLKAREKELREELATVCAIIPMPELRDSVSKLEEEKASSLNRLSKLQGEQTVCISAEEITRVEKEWKTWQGHVQTRRRIFSELWAKCTEVLPEDTTEEDLKVRNQEPPSFHNVV